MVRGAVARGQIRWFGGRGACPDRPASSPRLRLVRCGDALLSGYRRVLVVEDEPLLRGIIVRNLVSRGYVAREAASADEALAVCRTDAPELLLLDINLPDRTGGTSSAS